jgi:hypothetical protein
VFQTAFSCGVVRKKPFFTKRLRLRPFGLIIFVGRRSFQPDLDPDAPGANGATLKRPKNLDFAGD